MAGQAGLALPSGSAMRFSTFSCAMICAELAAACADLRREVAADDRLAGLGHLGVAAGVIGVHVGVDDPADRLVARDLLDFGNQLVGQRLGHRVHDQHAVVANLHRGVDAAADQHPDVALHVERFHVLASGSRALRLCGSGRAGFGLSAPAGLARLNPGLDRLGQRRLGAAAHLLQRQVVLLRVVARGTGSRRAGGAAPRPLRAALRPPD